MPKPIDGDEPAEVAAVLDQAFDIKARAGLHCAPAAHRTLGTFPSGTVRLSPGYFNTQDEMGATLEALSSIARGGTSSRPRQNFKPGF